jgi:hypothetical protein
MLYYQTVSPDLLTVLQQLMELRELYDFRVVGGTSLALQIGHRGSIDIDLFTDALFDNKEVQLILRDRFSSFQILFENKNGFASQINNIKIDFFNWHVAFIRPAILEDSLRLTNKEEIGAMKLETITTRKEKKDFIDIYFLLQQYPLKKLIDDFRIKYSFIDYKFAIESLMAVDYADKTEEPLMMQTFEWNKAKKYIVDCVKDYLSNLRKNIEEQQQERLRKAQELLKSKKDKPRND